MKSKKQKLIIKTLRKFEIAKGDNSLETTGHSSKLLNLFKYLLININEYRSIDLILENLSRDKEYENPKNAVQNMIYRLRKYIKDNEIFSDNYIEITYSNDSYKMTLKDSYVDFLEFERLIKEAQNLEEKDINKINKYKETVDMYAGEFLPELMYEDWVIPTRNYLNRLYLEGLYFLLEYYKVKNMIDEGIKLCEKAFKAEIYEEEVHLKYMEFLIGKGRTKEAKSHYEYITTLLYNQFGIRPTSQMHEVYNELKEKLKNINSNENKKVKYLWEETKGKGAFYCTYEEFYPIYILEKRRKEREGGEINPVSITFDANNNQKLLKEQTNRVIKIFINSLRKGDVICKADKNKILLLLPNLEIDRVKFVVNRVKNRINSYKEFKNIDLLINNNVNIEKKISLD